MIKVGLCGTIGSGKSTVCRIFEQLGVEVYIADDRAKELMITSPELVAQIVAAFGSECYQEGRLNRAYLAAQIFSSEDRRLQLNSIVHPAVCANFVAWADSRSGDYVVVESAILFESGLDKVVDYSVAVVAPESLCLERAMARDVADEGAIRARMATQKSAAQLQQLSDWTIENVELQSLEKQVVEIDKQLRCKR